MAAATWPARPGSSGSPSSVVACRLRETSFGRRWRWGTGPNTLAPKTPAPGAVRSPVPIDPFGLHWAAATFFWRTLGMARGALLVRAVAAPDDTRGAGSADSDRGPNAARDLSPAAQRAA